ncbi:helix-turn-helix domain-containing protein [Shewanella olleyana]|uniref:helix-turn-helix transcriptional regulator n=1 Tax=Shewanella olleyana TaxID=135626 RepID=UPI00200C3FD4|nr:helix-turn-helix domain-containing protein [Shewanella olleyana]MCL1067457.1 helix-turn-helix domain-containing protein [Shewanella olleyana]
MLPVDHQELVNFIADEIMTAEEASKLLRLSKGTLKKYRHKGIGPRYLKLEGAVRYKLSDIIQYVHSSTEGTTSVQNKAFLGILGTNVKLLHYIKNAIVKSETFKLVTPNSALLKQYLDKSNIDNIKWSFDNLTLNFELSEELGVEYQKVVEALVNSGLVKVESSSKQYSFRHRIYSSESNLKEGKCGIALLHNDLTKGHDFSFQIRLNPSQFDTKKKRAKLKSTLSLLFGNKLSETLGRAFVSRFDICFDLPKFNHDLVIYRFKSTRKRMVIRAEGKSNTNYICEGSRRRNRVKSYRKGDGTRIEFEFYPGSKKLSLNDLLDYEMPFKRFELYAPDFLLEDEIHPYTIHAINTLGINKAISNLDCKKEARILRKVLKKHLLVTDPEQMTLIARKRIKKFIYRLLKD